MIRKSAWGLRGKTGGRRRGRDDRLNLRGAWESRHPTESTDKDIFDRKYSENAHNSK